jgi:hypothetical protein
MDSTAKPTPAGAEDLLLPQGDTRPNADYERVVREELARVQERLAQLAPAGMSAAAPPEVKVAADTFAANDSNTNRLDANVTAFRAPDISGIDDRAARPPARRGVVRILTGLLVTGAIVGAGAAWASYGEAVRPMIANVAPQIGEIWSQVSERFGLSGEQGAPPVQTATADTAAPATPPPQANAPQAAPAAADPVSPDVAQMLQSMAHDIAGLQQGIDQLKAGQEQMARDNARLAEQLKASQEQLSRALARASEASLHPRPSPPAAPKPPSAVAHRPPPPSPVSTLPPPQPIAPASQAAAASPPPQMQADDGLPGAPRPPKPVP